MAAYGCLKERKMEENYLSAVEALVLNSQWLIVDALNEIPAKGDNNLRNRLLALEKSIKSELATIQSDIAKKAKS
jgi:hypothetical protein